MILTFRYRLKNSKKLAEKAVAVNQVWNYCGDVQAQAKRRGRRWPTFFDFNNLLAGSTKDLGLPSDTIQDVSRHFVVGRDAHKKRPRWRKSFGSRRSLGWIPFQSGRIVRIEPSGVRYRGVYYPVWKDRPHKGKVLCGSFNEDSRGRWFVNLTCEVPNAEHPTGTEEIGIDLGLRSLATLSTGEKLENPRHYKREEEALAKAQRAGRKDRAKAIYAKIKNRRKHDLHVMSRQLVNRAKAIYVGNVNSSALGQTRLAKSVYDVGWSMFRNMLDYKSNYAACVFRVVDEAYSTQTCSNCLQRSGPKGLKGLEVRDWVCSACGTPHDRDTNAAKNILISGQSIGFQQTESPIN